MATPEQISMLVLMVGNELFTPDQIGTIIDRAAAQDEDNGDPNMSLAAALVWEARAARYHGLVDTTESGSSRKMSDLYNNALKLAAYYRGLLPKDPDEETPIVGTVGTRTRAIIRP